MSRLEELKALIKKVPTVINFKQTEEKISEIIIRPIPSHHFVAKSLFLEFVKDNDMSISGSSMTLQKKENTIIHSTKTFPFEIKEKYKNISFSIEMVPVRDCSELYIHYEAEKIFDINTLKWVQNSFYNLLNFQRANEIRMLIEK